MKEAAGEANITIITIVLIAAVLGIGGIVVNRLMTSTQNNSCCQSIGGEVNGGQCVVDGVGTQMTQDWRNLNCPEQ